VIPDEDLLLTAKPRRTIGDAEEFFGDVVPTIDDPPDAPPPAAYKHWRDEDTRVVTYAINTTAYRGIPAQTAEAARAHCLLLHGDILETQQVPDRLFFRVRRVRSTK
jgi:hypothetical protein